MCAYIYIYDEIYYIKLCLQALCNLHLLCASHAARENSVAEEKICALQLHNGSDNLEFIHELD